MISRAIAKNNGWPIMLSKFCSVNDWTPNRLSVKVNKNEIVGKTINNSNIFEKNSTRT